MIVYGIGIQNKTDPYVGRTGIYACLFRCFGCRFLHPSTQGQKIKKGFLVFTRCTPTNKIPSRGVEAGDIAAGVGFRISRTGDTLCAGTPIIPGMVFQNR